jgi:poly-gamma-glutamate synthesis protein (capsule biosynthesis protein)
MSTINWTNGTCRLSDTSSPTARITIASDWGPLWKYEQPMRDSSLGVYGDLLPILRKADLNIVNVECVLGDAGEPIGKPGPNLRGDAQAVRSLVDVPFHVATLANNHTLDFGPKGLRQTIHLLQEAGLKTVGAGMSGEEAARPLVMDLKGKKLGLLNCSEGEACCSLNNRPGSHGFDVPALVRQVQDLKRRTDAVLVIFHGGREHAPMPPVYVVDALRQMADAGASAVIAHHPHVPQGIEIHNGVPIFYSQGNFIFNHDRPEYFQNIGYLVHLDFDGATLARWEITPYRMTDDKVVQLQGSERERLLGDLKHVSDLLADPKAVEQAWDAFVDQLGESGLRHTLETFVQLWSDDAPLAAARLHNLFFCPAHRNAYLNGLKRLSRGELGNSPLWAKDLVKDWTRRQLPPASVNNPSK